MRFCAALAIAASLLVAAGPSVAAFGIESTGSRREMMEKAASAIITSVLATSVLEIGTGFVLPASAKDENAPLVIRSAGCARGSGEACADLAEGNEFILNLQRKSQENAEQADRDALAAYNNKNFPEFMASFNPPKYLVKMPDGKFQVYDNVELSELKAKGKIKVERPLAKGGKIGYDLTQKPILVLVD